MTRPRPLRRPAMRGALATSTRRPAPTAPARRAASTALATAALLVATPAAHAATGAWETPVSVAEAPAATQNGVVTRVGLTANGRGTIAWNAGGTSPFIAL